MTKIPLWLLAIISVAIGAAIFGAGMYAVPHVATPYSTM